VVAPAAPAAPAAAEASACPALNLRVWWPPATNARASAAGGRSAGGGGEGCLIRLYDGAYKHRLTDTVSMQATRSSVLVLQVCSSDIVHATTLLLPQL